MATATTPWKAGRGADTLNGGEGSDTASYEHSLGGVTVDLMKTGMQLGTNYHYAFGDTLVSIENLQGSAHDDTLMGGGGADTLDGVREKTR